MYSEHPGVQKSNTFIKFLNLWIEGVRKGICQTLEFSLISYILYSEWYPLKIVVRLNVLWRNFFYPSIQISSLLNFKKGVQSPFLLSKQTEVKWCSLSWSKSEWKFEQIGLSQFIWYVVPWLIKVIPLPT